MGRYRILKRLERLFLHEKVAMEISGDIDEGFVVFHGHSAVIHCTKAGKKFSVYQNVTVGRNKEHYSRDGDEYPVFGDNVSLYSGCVVAGGIRIGNNVEIGANAVILCDVPDNCMVMGNPAYIAKMDGKKVKVPLNQAFQVGDGNLT